VQRRDFRVYVFSLPRCFSSACTGVAEKLGVKMFYTSEDGEKRQKMQEQYKKKLGDYVPNEHFYEITENQFENWMKVMETPYSGCKVIIPVNGMRWGAVNYHPARVLLMCRDVEEIRQSQQAFYRGDRHDTPEQAQMQREQLQMQIAHTEVQLREAKSIQFMKVPARRLIEEPELMIPEIADFLDAPNDCQDAIDSIDKTKYRFRREELTVDI